MKTCTKCKTSKSLDNFGKHHLAHNGIRSQCKLCERAHVIALGRTESGIVKVMYNSQKSSAKHRNMELPNYSRKDLENWLLNDWLFMLLYNNWKNCGYDKDLKPSCDRLDDYTTYTLDNLQLMTWRENMLKSHHDEKSGKLKKRLKAIGKYSLDGTLLNTFYSRGEVAKHLNKKCASNISSCCRGEAATAYGFVWKYI